jgi:hypothetical protein
MEMGNPQEEGGMQQTATGHQYSLDPDITPGAMYRNAFACMIMSREETGLSLSLS